MNYKNSKEFCDTLHITKQTLKHWKDIDKIKYIKLSSKKYLYDLDSILNNNPLDTRINVIYARVSNQKQINDLKTQTNFLTQYMVNKGVKPDMILEDITSGMNDNRINLNKLLQLISQNKVNTVYISYKDRLTRFGFDYFKTMFSFFNTNIEIVNLTKEEDFQQELTQDFIAIIHHFSMKMYSNRRKVLKNFSKQFNQIEN